MIAIDSSVLIDLLADDARAPAAEACLRHALGAGPVVLCEVVLSEVTAALGRGAEVADVIEEMGLHFSAIEQRSAVRAGEMQRRYIQRLAAAGLPSVSDARPRQPTTAPRTIPDFLVGAHALLQCTALITRDAGFFRDYFKGLKVIEPSVP